MAKYSEEDIGRLSYRYTEHKAKYKNSTLSLSELAEVLKSEGLAEALE